MPSTLQEHPFQFMPPAAGARTGRPGFTLLELIVVLTLIAMMSAAVLPVFNSTFNSVERIHALRDFTATLRYAHERAIADTKEYRVMLDPENGSYYLAGFSELGRRFEKKFAPVDDRLGEKRTLPQGIVMRPSKTKKDGDTHLEYVTFYPNGACDEVKISFVVNNRRTVSVTTSGPKGLILMEEK